jgi:hypothetical protein
MATAAQIKSAVDSKLAALWTTIQNKEAAYAAAHNGRFWQGLLTAFPYPADGATAFPTIGSACPTDQQGHPWPSAILTTPLEMAIQIDCYDGPLGQGYQATVYVTISGNTWTRTAQVGPEDWRVIGWAQLVAP